ncbi:MAG: ATP-binding protein [Spirochaetaceae bacterium]|jgi:hypothetical protein|nr:ATP-binding protein [Spirochaetaceae bacterium]
MGEKKNGLMLEQPILFEDRFLEKYVGNKLLTDPVTAIIELIANSWDAGATVVHIQWPEEKGDGLIITDNGCGLSENEFVTIWSTMAYDRTKTYGKYANDNGLPSKRLAFGRNGIGRFAGFCFADEYCISSTDKTGTGFNYVVKSKIGGKPLTLTKDNTTEHLPKSGMRIIMKNANAHGKATEEIRSEIGMRFFSDENFKIFIQNKLVTSEDIFQKNLSDATISIGENFVKIIVIDMVDTDRTLKHHGIAWKVNNRLVGEITWDGLSSNQFNVDGRRMESRRYSFIVIADFLDNYVLADWSGFAKTDPIVTDTLAGVYKFIWYKMIELTKDQREASFYRVKQSLNTQIQKMSPLKKEKWEQFIKDVQEKCPSLNEPELETLGAVLANLEVSQTKYELLYQLNELSADKLNDLSGLLQKYSVEYAKIVLDEIENRITLLKKLEQKLNAQKADEVHELQPLFERGLWIFGPEFESIEYTSNKGMTTVIQDIFGVKTKASTNRPDFVISTDSSISLYSCPSYDDSFEENGIGRLVIIELKAPGVKLNYDEIEQPKKYAIELFNKGLLQNKISKVTCFVIGQSIAQGLEGEGTARDGTIITRPMVYDLVIRKAKSRLFNLYDKLKQSPFMKEIDESYTKEIENARQSLF